MKTVRVIGTILTTERFRDKRFTREALGSAQKTAEGRPVLDNNMEVIGRVTTTKAYVETNPQPNRAALTILDAEMLLDAANADRVLQLIDRGAATTSIGFIVKRKIESLMPNIPSVIEEIDLRYVGIELTMHNESKLWKKVKRK